MSQPCQSDVLSIECDSFRAIQTTIDIVSFAPDNVVIVTDELVAINNPQPETDSTKITLTMPFETATDSIGDEPDEKKLISVSRLIYPVDFAI